jgi:methylmalonyl-CoA mutase cobalamin-binding subunit
VEHVLLCFRSHDPQVSLEPVVQGPAEVVQEAAQVDVREIVKLVVEWFKRLLKDS